MHIGEVIEYLRKGGACSREGWNGSHQFIKLQVPDEHSKMSLPYIYIRTVTKHQVPWIASQTDILANDWFAVAGQGDAAPFRAIQEK